MFSVIWPDRVKRIEDVRPPPRRPIPRGLRPARPSGAARFRETANYTATVYVTRGEPIRMLHSLLGPERFRAGTDLISTAMTARR